MIKFLFWMGSGAKFIPLLTITNVKFFKGSTRYHFFKKVFPFFATILKISCFNTKYVVVFLQTKYQEYQSFLNKA